MSSGALECSGHAYSRSHLLTVPLGQATAIIRNGARLTNHNVVTCTNTAESAWEGYEVAATTLRVVGHQNDLLIFGDCTLLSPPT